MLSVENRTDFVDTENTLITSQTLPLYNINKDIIFLLTILIGIQ